MTNKEFLFIFDAALSNPNGDPDQENKPRMDRATKNYQVNPYHWLHDILNRIAQHSINRIEELLPQNRKAATKN